MKTTLKEVFENSEWIITGILAGRNTLKISAKRRHPEADKPSFFCEWGNTTYISKLSQDNYEKSPRDFKCFKY